MTVNITEAKNTVVVTRGLGWGQTQEEWVYVFSVLSEEEDLVVHCITYANSYRSITQQHVRTADLTLSDLTPKPNVKGGVQYISNITDILRVPSHLVIHIKVFLFFVDQLYPQIKLFLQKQILAEEKAV